MRSFASDNNSGVHPLSLIHISGLIASLDKTANVMAKVTAPDFYLETSSDNPKKLGTVKVTRTIDELTHAYALVERCLLYTSRCV